MSEDIKIQTSAPDELSGGEQLKPERTGNEFRVNFPLSGRSGVEVTLGTTAARIAQGVVNGVGQKVDSCTSSGFGGVTAVPVSVKPVDRRTLEGSTPGDFRAKAAPAVLPNQPAPRQPVGQTPLSGRTPAAPAPASFDEPGA